MLPDGPSPDESQGIETPALPQADLLRQQARWLQPARSRLLRRAGVAHRRSVLDFGAGYGSVTAELVRRSAGKVIAFDCALQSLREETNFPNAFRVAGFAAELPFVARVFDLIFCQCSLMWMSPLDSVLRELWRVLEPGGVLVAIEPDYGGLIEFPQDIATREIWLTALARVGGDAFTGRRLPGAMESTGFDVQVFLLERLVEPSSTRFEFLESLPLSQVEADRLSKIKAASEKLNNWQQVVHLPFFLILAAKSAQDGG